MKHWWLQAVFNPKDPNTFASASLDRSIKVPHTFPEFDTPGPDLPKPIP